MAASYFLLLAQKKVTKEKGTLAAAVCRHPCRQTSRAGSGVRSRHVPVPRSDARASCARPFGLFPPPARRGREGPGKSRARQSLPQKRPVVYMRCRIYAVLPLLLSGPLGAAAKGGRKAACTARGRRDGSRRFRQQAMDGLWAKPVRP